MNLEQFLLTKLAEECTEIAHIALKTQQFGMTEKHPSMTLNNAERIGVELDDMMAILDLLELVGFDWEINADAIAAKRRKVAKYLKYSIQLGKVEPEAFDRFAQLKLV